MKCGQNSTLNLQRWDSVGDSRGRWLLASFAGVASLDLPSLPTAVKEFKYGVYELSLPAPSCSMHLLWDIKWAWGVWIHVLHTLSFSLRLLWDIKEYVSEMHELSLLAPSHSLYIYYEICLPWFIFLTFYTLIIITYICSDLFLRADG